MRNPLLQDVKPDPVKKSFPFWQDQGIISAKRLLYRMAGAIRSRRLTAALMANYTIPLRFMV